MKLNADQLRQKYLGYLKERDHTIVPSKSLVPENDPTTLFTTAGMQWMLPYLLGQKHPMGTRIANSQKCLRAEDIEEVGDNRHTTFFEMLGNWSFGDYFRREQLSWFFHFLVDEVGLDPQRLYVTAFKGDEEFGIPRDQASIKIWQDLFAEYDIEAKVVADPEQAGMADGRIFLYKWENWWSRAGEPANMPVGEPGGPDSEVFYDFGSTSGKNLHQNSIYSKQPCHLNCDCGRFLEIGNSVFMQFKKTQHGFEPLTQKNIDFGGGLERILAAAYEEIDIFKTPLFLPLINKISEISQTEYKGENVENFRIIADHIKAAVMLIADDVEPNNKEQGYMVRRLLRRGIRYGKLLGIQDSFLSELVEPVAEIYGQTYFELRKQKDQIRQVVAKEEKKFESTLDRGLREFDQAIEDRQKLTGGLAFKLYETYGFPLEMSVEEAERRDLEIDQDLKQDFAKAKKEHKEQSRAGAEKKFSGGLADKSRQTTKYHTTTHLILAALQEVLGDHVHQEGSNITQERLRFDFSHPKALTDDQISQVETLVNGWIKQELSVEKEIMDKKEALKTGASQIPGANYPDRVSIYSIVSENGQSQISKEFCGGPHVESTAQLSPIEIYKEKSAAAGVRRIYAREKQA
jgi:alanyl-tRNA synthetase